MENKIKMKYDILTIDPPYNHKKGGLRKVRPNQFRDLDYKTMDLKDIFKLLDKEIFPLTKENNIVFLWTISKYLFDVHKFMVERGYKKHAEIIWDKGNGIAPAFTLRYSHEYLIWYYKGKFIPVNKSTRGIFKSVFFESPREHSRKPDFAYKLINEWYPNLKKLDVFAREKRVGWDVWGDETDKFSTKSVNKTQEIN